VVSALRAAGCVFAEDEARLLIAETADGAELAAKVRRRVAGEPLEHVLGWAEFDGVRVSLEPGIFVPRRRSELLVLEALARARSDAVVLDLCCGSGAVGLALLTRLAAVGRPAAELHSVDVDAAAVQCAKGNLAGLPAAARGRLCRVYRGDLYQPLPERLAGRLDLIVVNPPYVPTAAIRLLPPEARDHEPRQALDGGVQGVDTQRRVAQGARRWLRAGGELLLQTSEAQADLTLELLEAAGLIATLATSSELDAVVAVGTHTGNE
jgi:release factor glutamine methyltransferase